LGYILGDFFAKASGHTRLLTPSEAFVILTLRSKSPKKFLITIVFIALVMYLYIHS
jgi:hypothetical protein